MPELGSYGSVRGAAGNSRPYREWRLHDVGSARTEGRRTQTSKETADDVAGWLVRRYGDLDAVGLLPKSGQGSAWTWSRAFELCPDARESRQLRNFLSLRGSFVALVPASSLRINGAAAGLKMLRLRLPMPSLPVVMITVRNRTLSRTVELFLDYMRDVANRSTSHAGSKRRNLASLSGYVFFKIGMSQAVTFMSASFL